MYIHRYIVGCECARRRLLPLLSLLCSICIENPEKEIGTWKTNYATRQPYRNANDLSVHLLLLLLFRNDRTRKIHVNRDNWWWRKVIWAQALDISYSYAFEIWNVSALIDRFDRPHLSDTVSFVCANEFRNDIARKRFDVDGQRREVL